MKIKTKIIILIFILSLIIFVALHTTASFVIVPSYQVIENQESEKSVNQALSMMSYRFSELEGKVREYSSWDDTYSFILNPTQGYIDTNLITASENFDLNLIVMVDTSDKLVYCQSYDSNQSAMVPASQETRTILRSDDLIWDFQSTDHLISGLMLLDGKPTLVATAPILTSLGQGPIRGGLLFAKYLDAQETKQLTEITGLNFSLFSVNDFRLQNGGNLIVDSLAANQETILVKENSPELISGYALVKDVHSNPLFILQVSQNRIAYQQGVLTRNIFLAAALLLSVSFGVGVLLLFESQIVKPLTNLAGYVKGFFSESNANTSEQYPRFGTDEIAVLANVIKDSANQKLDTMNEVSRMVAHDLRNPLTGIKGASYSLKKNYGPVIGEKGQALLKVIDNCVDYSDKIVTDLWEYSSEIKLDKIKTSPSKLVKASLSTVFVPSNITVVNEASGELSLLVDTGKIERVFSNLIKNAIDAMPDGGTLKVTSKTLKGEVEIDFSDNGLGMSQEVIKKLGMPFFTTKAKGMGVGLSICKRIIDSHRGRIEVKSVEAKGTCFSVFLPSE